MKKEDKIYVQYKVEKENEPRHSVILDRADEALPMIGDSVLLPQDSPTRKFTVHRVESRKWLLASVDNQQKHARVSQIQIFLSKAVGEEASSLTDLDVT